MQIARYYVVSFMLLSSALCHGLAMGPQKSIGFGTQIRCLEMLNFLKFNSFVSKDHETNTNAKMA